MKKWSFLVPLVSLIFLVSACSSDDKKHNGTSDSGGGVIGTSTEAEVREAVSSSIQILRTKSFFENVRGLSHFKFQKKSLEEKKAYFFALTFLQFPDSFYENFGQFSDWKDYFTKTGIETYSAPPEVIASKLKFENAGEYLVEDKIKLKEKGACTADDKIDADASVSRFDLDAEICLSLENLKKIPKESLRKHVTALLAHELTHMFGFNEISAKMIQEAVAIEYEEVISSSASRVPSHLLNMLLSSLLMMEKTKSYALYLVGWTGDKIEASERAKYIYYCLGNVAGKTSAFLEVFDESNESIKVFYSEETKEKEAQVIKAIYNIQDFTSRAFQMSDEELSSEAFQKELEEQTKWLNQTIVLYGEIVGFYEKTN